MLAKLVVAYPIAFAVQQVSEYSIHETEIDGYKIRMHPPVPTEIPVEKSPPLAATVDGVPARICNGLRIDFLKEEFDRSSEECDPSHELIRRALNSLLLRLRFVGSGYLTRQSEFPKCYWWLDYLNDDETKLPPSGGRLVGSRGNLQGLMSCIVVDNNVWDDLNALDFDYEPPSWVLLLLDAREALPAVGPAIVLAATALEVFAAHILNQLAEKSEIPGEMWKWINSSRRREPTLAEQYDELLRILLGTSLKENNGLWEGFTNLRDARNSFVHEGQALIGGRTIDRSKADELIGKAEEIVKFVRLRLPREMQWPIYERSISFAGSIPVVSPVVRS